MPHRFDLARRETLTSLLKTALLGSTGLALGGCESLLEQIRNRPMRRDLATLAANDPVIDTYKAAVSAMKALPASDPRSWAAQAQIHLDHCPHGNWYFLPWHRAYLIYFEALCRDLSGNPGFALPYWNWACQRSIPGVFFGGAANPLFDGTRTRGAADTLPDAFVGPAVMDSILTETNFLLFASGASATQRGASTSGTLEATPHNNVHGWISGNMGSFLSPLDPVFWTHHNMIDRIWWDWNAVLGNANSSDTAWANFRFNANFVQANGSAVDVVAGATVLGPLLLYQFDDAPIGACAAPGIRRIFSDTAALRRYLETGAAVRVRTLRSLAATGALELPVGRSTTQRLRSPDAAPLALADLPKDLRVLLRVRPARQPRSGEYFVRVFVERPDATAETPITDPHYAGSFGFFNDDKMPHAGHAGHESPAFLVDTTAAIRRLNALDRVRSGDISVQLVPVPMPGRQTQETRLSLAELQLELSESVAAEPRPFGLAKTR